MATISITPSTPVSLPIISFIINGCFFNLINGAVTLNVTKTFADGSTLDEQIVLSDTDAASFLATTATAGQALSALGAQAAVVAIASYYGFTVSQ